jgi:hypothetical protein
VTDIDPGTLPKSARTLAGLARDAGWTVRVHRAMGTRRVAHNVDHKRAHRDEDGELTLVVLVDPRWDLLATAAWWNGKSEWGYTRHLDDPVPVDIGVKALTALVRVPLARWPRWQRPDLGNDEGSTR